MILNPESDYQESIVEIRGVPVKNTSQFKYLDSYICPNEPNTEKMEVNYRSRQILCIRSGLTYSC